MSVIARSVSQTSGRIKSKLQNIFVDLISIRGPAVYPNLHLYQISIATLSDILRLKWVTCINGKIIINNAYIYSVNLPPKRFRLSASTIKK